MGWDLHMHTTASDGSLSPTAVVQRAATQGLIGIAITDHDTLAGVAEAEVAGRELGIVVVAGVEISTRWQAKEWHILGYGPIANDPTLQSILAEQRRLRQLRNQKLLRRLAALSLPLTWEEVEQQVPPGGQAGRLHIAAALVAKGMVRNEQAAFDRYLGERGKAYIEVERLTPAAAIASLRAAGGQAVLAHPGVYSEAWKTAPWSSQLWGIEADHPDHSPALRLTLHQLAQERGWITTAGSDFHGLRDGRPYHAELGTCRLAPAVGQRWYHDLYGKAMPLP